MINLFCRQTLRGSSSKGGVPPNGPSQGTTGAAAGRPAIRSASSTAARSIRSLSARLTPSPPAQSSEAANTAGRRHRGAQVGEQRAQRELQRQRVPGGAGGGAQQRRLADERVAVQDVEEGLEQAAVGGGEDRCDGDQPVRPGDRL